MSPTPPPQCLRAWPAALCLALAGALMLASPAHAAGDKLLLTGGVSSVDGAAGGGLTPWALIGSYASTGQWGVTAFGSQFRSQSHRLAVHGLTLAWNDRLELSLARQRLDTGTTGTALGLPGLVLQQDIVGLKWHLAGDAVLDSDSLMPALAVGVLAKRADPGGLAPTLASLGATRSGVELYFNATKLLLAQGLLVNATLRASKANQNGLLGFGGAATAATAFCPSCRWPGCCIAAWRWAQSFASSPATSTPALWVQA